MSKLKKSIVISDSNYTPETSPRIKVSEKSNKRTIENKSTVENKNDEENHLSLEVKGQHQKSKSALRTTRVENPFQKSLEDEESPENSILNPDYQYEYSLDQNVASRYTY